MSGVRRILLIAALALLAPAPVRAQADAYLDPGARALMEQARERRRIFDTSIQRYSAVAQERMSAGLNTLGRERLLFRRETATRIDWQREGPVNIEVLGGREVIPVAIKGVRLPSGIASGVSHLAFDPVGNELFLMSSEDPDESFRHPLAEGSEEHYRFRSGDTTTIRLQGGRSVRLIELVVIPRRQDARLLNGSFWIDEATHGLVQAVFRLARPFELGVDGGDDDDDMPGFLRPVRADVTYFTIEYTLWELRWWLPRLVAAEGWFQAGSLLRMPLRYERRYSEYDVVGDPSAPTVTDIEEARPCRPPFRLTINVNLGRDGERRDTVRVDTTQVRGRRMETPEDSAAAECARRYVVEVPTDTARLLANEYLPGSIYERGETLISQSELEGLKSRIEDLGEAPWQSPRGDLAWGFGGAGLLRYNRVEALSVGARGTVDVGRLTGDATARIAVSDWEPSLEVGLNRATLNRGVRLAAYRRLDLVDRAMGGLGTGNSLNALLFGRDDGDYFRATGAELLLTPPEVEPRWYELRLYGERQRPVDVETDFSVRHLFSEDHIFRPNLQAARADQAGAELTLRIWRGLNPEGFRWGGHIGGRGETGDFRYGRFSAGLETTFPLPFGAVAALGGAAGTSTGDVPPQGLWLLGGPATLRGYDGAAAAGEAFWRGRAELARGIPAARLALFSDLGWAGPRDGFEASRPLLSAGVGASFLDGIVRADLARALRGKTGWRFDLYLNGSL